MNFIVLTLALYFVYINNVVHCRDDEDILKGLFVSVLTPMEDSGRVNLTVIPAYAEYLKKHGVDGIVLTAIAGEGPNLNVREKKSIYDAWTMFAKDVGLKVIAQVGGASLPDILELAKYANDLNVDAILVLPTSHYRPKSPEHLVDLMDVICKAAPSSPLIYYDHPDMSHVNMPEFFKLATKEIPNFKGILTQLRTALSVDLANELKYDQTIFIFDFAMVSAAAVNGFDSFILAGANICPELFLDVIKYIEKDNFEKAKNAQWAITELIYDIAMEYEPISALKVATELTSGIKLGNTRKPLPGISEDGRKDLAKILKEHDIYVARKY